MMFSYTGDESMYANTYAHAEESHSDIKIGQHRPSKSLRAMAAKYNYRYLGKKFQTRFGLGFHCAGHPHAVIGQYPEGFAKHYREYHKAEILRCPVIGCIDEQSGQRNTFSSIKNLYLHVTGVHQKAVREKLSQILNEHNYARQLPFLPEFSDGWLYECQLDLTDMDEISDFGGRVENFEAP